jgi:uncharacterized protein (DUF983 family)
MQALAFGPTVRAGLFGCCPRCGRGKLFTGPLTLAVRPTCERCGLDYGFSDSGDGPAVFAILLLGFMVLGAALVVEFRFDPPVWVHLVLWLPLTVLVGYGVLRPLKGVLIALQYFNRAEEGRLADRSSPSDRTEGP